MTFGRQIASFRKAMAPFGTSNEINLAPGFKAQVMTSGPRFQCVRWWLKSVTYSCTQLAECLKSKLLHTVGMGLKGWAGVVAGNFSVGREGGVKVAC